MHTEHVKSTHDRDDEESERQAVVAADDTGMVAQQETLGLVEIHDAATGDVVEREPR